MKTLLEFWSWAEVEKPHPANFIRMAGVNGNMTDQAQEAVDTAVEIIERQCACASGLEHRGALKDLSVAILTAWEVTPVEKREPEPEAPPIKLSFQQILGRTADMVVLAVEKVDLKSVSITEPWPEDEKWRKHGC